MDYDEQIMDDGDVVDDADDGVDQLDHADALKPVKPASAIGPTKGLLDVRKVLETASAYAIIPDRAKLMKLFNILRSVTEEAPMVFSSKGICCDACNGSSTAMYSMMLPPDCVLDWKFRLHHPVFVCFDIKLMNNILKCGLKDEQVALVIDRFDESVRASPQHLRVMLWDPRQEKVKGFQRSSFKLPLKQRESEPAMDFTGMPNLVSFAFDAAVLHNQVESFKNLGNIIRFKFVPGVGLSLKVGSEVGLVRGGRHVEAMDSDSIDLPPGQVLAPSFLLALMSLITDAHSQSQAVRVVVKDNAGLTMLHYRVFETGHLQFFIAPRMSA